jgi:transcription antitermination factor NusG
LRRWSDRIKQIQTPLFPGYVFARFDCRDRLPILITPGVIDIVGFGQEYIPVSDLELHTIRRVLQSRTKCEPEPFLRIDGFLKEIKRTRRLVVSISLLQRSVNVELNSEWIIGFPSIWQPELERNYAHDFEDRA